jgi:hypothetical protein
MQLKFFGTNDMALDVWKVDAIKSSSDRRIAHC